jgi:hypothetical protein
MKTGGSWMLIRSRVKISQPVSRDVYVSFSLFRRAIYSLVTVSLSLGWLFVLYLYSLSTSHTAWSPYLYLWVALCSLSLLYDYLLVTLNNCLYIASVSVYK